MPPIIKDFMQIIANHIPVSSTFENIFTPAKTIKYLTTTVNITASMKFESGPASATKIMSRRGFLNAV